MNNRRDESVVRTAPTVANDRPARNGERGTMQKVEESIAYMREHLDRPLQVAALAALANVSPSHFFALFKRRTGCAPIDFFTRLRMDRARRLLEATSLRVKEVATALGYEDQFYFSRVFKSVNNLAPSEYRLSHQNGADGNAKRFEREIAMKLAPLDRPESGNGESQRKRQTGLAPNGQSAGELVTA
jgi:transcriptional regulator GlxA family with amidase domain